MAEKNHQRPRKAPGDAGNVSQDGGTAVGVSGGLPADKGIRQSLWFSNGATMVYSRRWRLFYWFINLLLYILLNMYSLRLRTGEWVQFEAGFSSGYLIPDLLSPLNIFYFPSYILVIGFLMAMICSVPILTAQLGNFLHSLPFVLVVLLFGHNQALSFSLLFSCTLVSFELLRFKSKFVAALLCLLPVLVYWILWGGPNPEPDILRWAVLYAPWGLALLICLIFFGAVLGIGHFLRYRPGIVMPIFGLVLAGTLLLFHYSIGISERDFQALVYCNSPSQTSEFSTRSIVPMLQEELAARRKQTPYLKEELLEEQIRLEWRWAFQMGPGATVIFSDDVSTGIANPVSSARREVKNIIAAQIKAVDHIEKQYIQEYRHDRRVADALYYKALLIDMNVDHRALRDEDTLRFYYDHTNLYSQDIWQEILNRFGDTAVGVEARLRLARLIAGQKPATATDSFGFNEALSLLAEGEALCNRLIHERAPRNKTAGFWSSRLGKVFSEPTPTVTWEQLRTLKQRMGKFKTLIGAENRTGHAAHNVRLAEFVKLDPRQLSYEEQLKNLLLNSPQPDPLIDNIELAQVMLERDIAQRMRRLSELAEQYSDRDGGAEAMVEYVKLLLTQSKTENDTEYMKQLYARSGKYLQKVIDRRPGSYLAEHAELLLQKLPLE